MKKLFKLLLPAFAISLFLSAAACHRGKEARIDFVKSRISSQLDLNEEQEAKLNEVAAVVKEQMKQHKPEAPTGDLKTLLEQPALDAAQTKALFEKRKDEMEARADAMYEAVFPKLAAFHASLNDEQRKKAVAMLDKFHNRMQKKWNRE